MNASLVLRLGLISLLACSPPAPAPSHKAQLAPSAKPILVARAPSTAGTWAFHGFYGATAVFSVRADGGFTTVLRHVKTGQTHMLLGRPWVEDEISDERTMLFDETLLGHAKPPARTSGGRLLLLEQEHALAVVDLERGNVLTRYEGDALDARFDPNGKVVAVTTPSAVHFLEIEGTRRTEIAISGKIGSGILWNAGGARFHTEHGVDWQFFAQNSWSEWTAPNGARVLSADEDGRVSLLRGEALEHWMLGEGNARGAVNAKALSVAKFDSEFFESAVHGDSIVYSVPIPRQGLSDAFEFHIARFNGGPDVVFRATADCSPYPERIVSFDDKTVVTDTSCSLGCPSESYTPDQAIYDRKTGALLRHKNGATERPYTHVQAEMLSRVTADAEALGRTLETIVLLPGSARRYVIAQDGALRVHNGTKHVILEGSSGSSELSTVVASDDGDWIALPDGDGFRAWDTRSGAPLFRVGP